jgi:hypothetical protein
MATVTVTAAVITQNLPRFTRFAKHPSRTSRWTARQAEADGVQSETLAAPKRVALSTKMEVDGNVGPVV